MAVLSFNAGHSPWDEEPPANCLPAGYPTPSTEREYYKAMLVCMDHEIGEVIDELDATGELEDTTVIFLGDNGTAEAVGSSGNYPVGHWKGTVYEGGVCVPLIVADGYTLAHGVPDAREGVFRVEDTGRSVAYPVHTQDLFNTVLDLAGYDTVSDGDVDSVSLVPYLAETATGWLRTSVTTDSFDDTKCLRAARDETYKLVRTLAGGDEFFDLDADPTEEAPLDTSALSGEEQAAHDALVAALPSSCP